MIQPEVSAAELAAFDAAWDDKWPGCRPVGHELRSYTHGSWVRFHSLPDSKRYAESDAEYAEVLRRHRELLSELASMSPDAGEDLLVVTASWSTSLQPSRRDKTVRRAFPSGAHWRSVPTDPDDPEEAWTHLYLGQTSVDAPALTELLLLVADDKAADVIVTNRKVSWLYHPYDGGSDIIAPDSEDRDALLKNHADWRSGHPLGL